MNNLERVNLDKIEVQLENTLVIAFEKIKQNNNIDYEQFKSYFSKVFKEIDVQTKNQEEIKKVMTNLFNVM